MIRKRSIPKLLAILFILVFISGFFFLSTRIFGQFHPIELDRNVTKLLDAEMLQRALEMNRRPYIQNEHRFHRLTDDDLILVVQVHRRPEYLKNLISSMARVRHIDQTLIVFSHDFYDIQINRLIDDIQFAKTFQIFYPFSIQIWTGTFPGSSANDCPRDLPQSEAIRSGCTNADHPDSYGHYREAPVAQIKHHWWWKLHQVMDHLKFTRQHSGDFVFLEEDHYLSPDFVHVWRLMKASQNDLKLSGTRVDLLTMGHYQPAGSVPDPDNTKLLSLTEWVSSKHNMAFTMDRTLWTRIKRCQAEFCRYDDYNWDWSLQHVMRRCLKEQLVTLVPSFSRAYHLGDCGMHHKGADCNKRFEQLERMFKTKERFLFPDNVTVRRETNGPRFRPRKEKNYGGWADPRDQNLCIQYQFSFEEIVRNHSALQPYQKIEVH